MKNSHYVTPRSLREAQWTHTHYYTPPRRRDTAVDWGVAVGFGLALGVTLFLFS